MRVYWRPPVQCILLGEEEPVTGEVEGGVLKIPHKLLRFDMEMLAPEGYPSSSWGGAKVNALKTDCQSRIWLRLVDAGKCVGSKVWINYPIRSKRYAPLIVFIDVDLMTDRVMVIEAGRVQK